MILHVHFKQKQKDIRTLVGTTHETRLLELHKTLDLHNQNLKFMIIRENSRNNYYHKLEIMILHVRFKQIKNYIDY